MATDGDAGHTTMSKTAVKLLDWPEDTPATLTLLQGGATGRTFSLTAPDKPSYCVRSLRADGSDTGLESVSRALADAGVSPAVVAASSDLLITELVPGKPVTVGDLGDASGDKIRLVGQLVARLHSVKPAGVGVEPRSEMDYWWDKAVDSMPAMDPDMKAALTAEVEVAKAAPAPAGPAGALVTAHGDLHPGNILLGGDGSSWLVDLEHVGGRWAGDDICYLFAVWGDLRYMAGWAPSADAPTPYAQYEARCAFATHYLTALSASSDGAPPSDADVEEFLFQVESCGHRTRARLMTIWILMAGGDKTHMMVGAAGAFIGHLLHAKAILTEIVGGDAELKADVVKRGLIVVAAARGAAAAAAATTE